MKTNIQSLYGSSYLNARPAQVFIMIYPEFLNKTSPVHTSIQA